MQSSEIQQRLQDVRATLAPGVRLVAVSKFHPVEALQAAYDAGQRRFGESRVQEFLAKQPQLPADIEWHFIGHLQTNKVRQIVGRVALIESVDSQHLLDEIDRRSADAGVITRVLMQVHVAAEETKFGWLPDELVAYFAARSHQSLRATHICGIMGMATNTDNRERIAADFRAIADTHARILAADPSLRGFDTISMGMSDDYLLAQQCGSNMVRVGSRIFGARQ